MGWRRLGSAALAVACGACFEPGVYRCRTPDGCDAGVCEPSGYCSYPDEACDSGRRFSSLAGDGLAGACVEPAAPGTTGESEPTGSGSTTPSDPVCGDGVLEGDEACDDGNDVPGDGCSPECVASGTPLWQTVIAGEGGFDDRAWAVAILAPSDVVIAGMEGPPGTPTEAFYARLGGADGELVWSDTFAGTDAAAEQIVVNLSNEIIVGGPADDGPWVRKVAGDGEVIWESRPSIGRLRGIAPNVGGAMLAGHVSDPEGGTQAVLVGVGADSGAEAWRQVMPEANAFTSIGPRGSNDALLLATIASERTLLRGGDEGFEILATIDALTEGRAQALAVRDDEAIVGGYLEKGSDFDWWIGVYDGPTQRWTDTGTFLEGVALADEFEDVAFMPDGSVVGVGLVTNEDKDIWVAVFDASGAMKWSRVLPDDNRGDDVARSVAVAPDGALVVAGSTTIDESRDTWVAKLVP